MPDSGRVFRRPSRQTVSVLLALATDPARWRHGYELGREVGLKAGSLYPILMRLSDRGLLESKWESDVPSGRPPRHLYRLSGTGVTLAGELDTAEPVRPRRSGTVKSRPATRSLRGAW